MRIKTISYQRVINLGSYENKRLEMTAELSEVDDALVIASKLMEFVEAKIREDSHRKIQDEITEAVARLTQLKKQIGEYESLTSTPDTF